MPKILFSFLSAMAFLFSFTVHAGETKLHVLSFNIHGLPSIAIEDEFKQERFALIGKLLKEAKDKPDIVLLQEGFDGATDDLLSAAGFPFMYKGPETNSILGASSGLYILSRYPIHAEAKRAFGSVLCSSWDCLANKGVEFVEITVPGLPRPLEIFNTHMQSGLDDGVRQGQSKILVDFFKAHHREGNPVIFAGDFNFRPGLGHPSYKNFMQGTGLANAGKFCLDSGCAKTPDTSWKGVWEYTVDHQFFSQDGLVKIVPLSVERTYAAPVNNLKLSDHPAHDVEYTLRWKSNADFAAVK